MFTSGGQLDLLSFAGMRGGGKGGGGGGGVDPRFVQTSFVDPVDGSVFTSTPASTFGGGNPDAATQLNTHIAARKQGEKEASDKAAADKAASDAAAETTFQGSRQSAYNDALTAAQHAFQLQGVDPANYMASDIVPALQRQFNSIQDLDPNPSSAFPTSLGDTIVGNVLSGKRTQATNALNQSFTPTFSQNMLPDSSVGNFVSDIVNEQFNPLSQQLTNALKRNTLSPVGFNAATDALNQKKAAATATVGDLGRGILATDRSGLDDLISGARTSANSLGLADNFDPSAFVGQANTKAQEDLSNFGGALRNAVGGTQFADIQGLINAGGAVQGANNPNAANPTGGVQGTSSAFVPEDVLAQQKRGLGSVGAF